MDGTDGLVSQQPWCCRYTAVALIVSFGLALVIFPVSLAGSLSDVSSVILSGDDLVIGKELKLSLIILMCGGLGYTFAVYSQHLKETLDYSQEDLDGIGAAKDLGYCIGIVGGILYNFFPPWLAVCVGSLLHFMGYFMLYLTSAGRIEPPFWMVCTFIAVGVGGDSWIDTAAVMTSVQNFSDCRGTAIGLLKAQVGLSGAFFVILYEAFLKPNVNGYVLLVATAPAVASATLAVFIRPFPSDDQRNGLDLTGNGRFHMAYMATIILGLYLLSQILVQTWTDVKRPWLIFFAVTTLIQLLLLTFLLTLFKSCRSLLDFLTGGKPECTHSEEMLVNACLNQKPSDLSLRDVALEDDNKPQEFETQDSQEDLHDSASPIRSHTVQKQGYHILQPQSETLSNQGLIGMQVVTKEENSEGVVEMGSYSLSQCVQSFNFWLLCLVTITGPGTGLAVINNFGQIGRSLHAQNVELFVGLISVSSCFGRLTAGYGSDLVLKLTPYPRPVCLAVAHLIMALGCLTIATGSVPLLYVGTVLVGSSYGAFWALTPSIIPEVFGIQNFAARYKLIGSGGSFGAYVLSAKVVGHFYDEEAEYYHTQSGTSWDNDGKTCVGRQCFGFSIFILAIVCMVGASLGTILSIRTKKLYAQMKHS